MSCVLVLLMAIDAAVVCCQLVRLVVPLPFLLYLRGARLQGSELSHLQHDPK
jgi:hypothetical protein